MEIVSELQDSVYKVIALSHYESFGEMYYQKDILKYDYKVNFLRI